MGGGNSHDRKKFGKALEAALEKLLAKKGLQAPAAAEPAGFWSKLWLFVEQPFVLLFLAVAIGVVGIFFYRVVLYSCSILVLFALQRSNLFVGKSWKKQIAVHCLVLLCVLGLLRLIVRQIDYKLAADKPTVVPATKDDIADVKKLFLKFGSISTSGTNAEESLAGFSIQMLIRINKASDDRRSYLFDVGNKGRDRFSIYISQDKHLTVALSDSNGELYPLRIAIGEGGVPLGSIFFLTAEFGIGSVHSTVRVRVNSAEVSSLNVPWPIAIGTGAALWNRSEGAILGSDLDHNNGGVFDAFEMLIYSRTLTQKEAEQNLLASQQRLTIPTFIRFSGKQWAHKNTEDNNMTLSDPRVWMTR